MFNLSSLVLLKKYSFLARWLLNALLFDLGWWVCIKHADDQPYLGPLLVAFILLFFLLTSASKLLDLALMLTLAGVGTLIDSLYIQTGMIVYHGSYTLFPKIAPLWMTSLWALYGISVNCSLAWLQCSILLAALVGSVGGALSYLAGVRMGAAEFLWPDEVCILAIAVVWALIVPLSLKFSICLKNTSSFHLGVEQ